jgi:curved DNA-binding protein CbpA
MTHIETHYEALEVSPRASAVVIQAAYRCLAQRYHPDRQDVPNQADGKFKQISAAFKVLRDPSQKEAYDRSLGLITLANDRRGRGKVHAGYLDSLSAGPDRSRPFGFRPLV